MSRLRSKTAAVPTNQDPRRVLISSRFKWGLLLLLGTLIALMPEHIVRASGTISLTAVGAAYTQDFNTLANTGTSSAVPAGWALFESSTNANTTYTAGTGSSTAGDTYSFGSTTTPTDRAFGTLQSGTLIPTIGASFTNNTGNTITSLAIAYTGEQWRCGQPAAGRTGSIFNTAPTRPV